MSATRPTLSHRKVPLAIALVALLALPLPVVVAEATVPEQPDLVAHDVRAHAQADGSVVVTGVVTNRGLAPAPESWARFAVDGVNLSRVRVSALEPGENITLVSPNTWNGKGGLHVAELWADAGGEVVETDERNNVARTEFGTGAPDLVVERLRAVVGDAASDGSGFHVHLEGVVANVGDGPATGSAALFHLDGRNLPEARVPALAPGEAVLLRSASATVTRGEHTAALVADAGHHVRERDETNNAAKITFFADAPLPPPPPSADLRVRILDVERDPARTDLGDAAPSLGRRHVRVEVCNAGPDAAHGTVTLSVRASTRYARLATGDTLAGYTTPRLVPGDCDARTIRWDPTALGEFEYAATAWPFRYDARDGPGTAPARQPVVDPHPSNNEATARDFVGVGGLGGVVLPLP